MRVWLIITALCSATAAFAGGDQQSCMEACSAKTAACMNSCKDEKCGTKCASKIEQCAKTCEGKSVNSKAMDAAKKDASSLGNSKNTDKDR